MSAKTLNTKRTMKKDIVKLDLVNLTKILSYLVQSIFMFESVIADRANNWHQNNYLKNIKFY